MGDSQEVYGLDDPIMGYHTMGAYSSYTDNLLYTPRRTDDIEKIGTRYGSGVRGGEEVSTGLYARAGDSGSTVRSYFSGNRSPEESETPSKLNPNAVEFNPGNFGMSGLTFPSCVVDGHFGESEEKVANDPYNGWVPIYPENTANSAKNYPRYPTNSKEEAEWYRRMDRLELERREQAAQMHWDPASSGSVMTWSEAPPAHGGWGIPLDAPPVAPPVTRQSKDSNYGSYSSVGKNRESRSGSHMQRAGSYGKGKPARETKSSSKATDHVDVDYFRNQHLSHAKSVLRQSTNPGRAVEHRGVLLVDDTVKDEPRGKNSKAKDNSSKGGYNPISKGSSSKDNNQSRPRNVPPGFSPRDAEENRSSKLDKYEERARHAEKREYYRRRCQWQDVQDPLTFYDFVELSQKDIAFILGKHGSTKEKIAKAAGCNMDIPESHQIVELWSKDEEALKRGMKYVGFVRQQRQDSVLVNLALHDDGDLTVVKIPSSTVGFVTGSNGTFLRMCEQQYTTLMFFCDFRVDENGTKPRLEGEEAEFLAIFGDEDRRKGSSLKVMSAVESKMPGYFVGQIEPNYTSDSPGFDTETLTLTSDELSFALGKEGTTRRKLATASEGGILEFVNLTAFICGTYEPRKRLRDYLGFLLKQRRGDVLVPNAAQRDDCTVYDIFNFNKFSTNHRFSPFLLNTWRYSWDQLCGKLSPRPILSCSSKETSIYLALCSSSVRSKIGAERKSKLGRSRECRRKD